MLCSIATKVRNNMRLSSDFASDIGALWTLNNTELTKVFLANKTSDINDSLAVLYYF